MQRVPRQDRAFDPRWQIDDTSLLSYLPSAAWLAVGALLWRRIDASQELGDASKSIVGEILPGK